eukprot:6402975-Prorocentrum_lima.AAC.1
MTRHWPQPHPPVPHQGHHCKVLEGCSGPAARQDGSIQHFCLFLTAFNLAVSMTVASSNGHVDESVVCST